MLRTILLVPLLVAGGVYVASKTDVFDRVGETVCSKVRHSEKATHPQDSIRAEIENVRQEIASMNSDFSSKLHPIAEYKADVDLLAKSVKEGRSNLAMRRGEIVNIARELKKVSEGEQYVHYFGEKFATKDLRSELERKTAACDRADAKLASQERLLEAKRRALAATREQLEKLIAKRSEFEVELARLEAAEEELRTHRIASNLQVDNSRATQIKSRLEGIQRRLAVLRAKLDIVNGPLGSAFMPQSESTPSTNHGDLDLDSIIEEYGNGDGSPTRTVRN